MLWFPDEPVTLPVGPDGTGPRDGLTKVGIDGGPRGGLNSF